MPYTDDQIEYLQSAAPGVQAAAVGKLSDSERSDLMSSLVAYKAKKNPTSRPKPAGATGEIASLSPEDYARSEARNEREGTPLEQMTGQGGALKTLPRRIHQAAAYGVGKSATDELSIPGGLVRLAALPAYALGMKTVGDAYNHFADYISPSKDIETLEAQAPKTTEGEVVSMAAKFASDTVTFGASGTPSWALPSIFAINSASSAGNTAHQNNQDVEHPVRTAIGAITDAGLAYLGGSLFGKAPGSNLAVKAASDGAIGSAVQWAQNVVAKHTYDPNRSLHDGVVESSLMYGAGALAHGINQRSALRKGMETHPQGPNGFMQDMQSAMDNAEIAKHEGRLKPGAYQEIRNAWEMARNIHEKLMGSEAGKKFQAKAAAPEEFPAARKLFNRDTPPAQEEAQNAVQVGRPEEVVPREGGQGRNFPEGGQGVGQGLEGEETPSQGQAQEEGQVTRLPRELAGAKPRYNIGVEKHTPVFENDIDKALFIVAQTTPSRNDAKYMEWLQERFPDLDQDEIRDKGKEVKAEIKKLAKGNKGGGELPVPDQQPKPVPKPPVANGRKLPIISEDELGHPAIARDVTPEPVAPEGAPSPATPEENETEYQEHQNAQPRIPAASRLEVNDRVPQGGGNGKAEAIPGVEGGPENAPASGGNGVQDESAVGRLRSAKSNAIKTFTDTGESKIKPHHLTLHKGMNPRKGAEASMALGSDEILSHPDSGTLKSGTSYKQEGNTVTFGLPDAMGSLEVSLHPSKGVASFDHIHVSENIKGKGKGKDFMQEAARFINAAYPEVHTVYLEATTEDAHNIMASYPGAVRDGNDYVIPIGELANRTSHPKAEAKPNPMAKYPIVGDVYTVPIGDVHVKPKVYQFREFLHDPLAGSGPYNKQLAGEYWGWVNEKGELDLIDGHHRYKKAMAEGVKEIPVKIIQAKDASEARVAGAMKNIAQGDASPVDAARLFREAKYTREDIKAEGIPMTAGLVDSAVALNEVTPDWFELAASDDNWEKAAIVVGKNLPGQTDAQTALLNDLGEAKKTDLNPDYIKNLCDEVKSAKVSKGDEGGLFGAEDLKSNMRSRATIATALEKSLREDQSAANAGSKKKIARKLEDWKVAEGGLNTDIASAMGEETTRQAQTFRNEKNHTGEINDILDEYADRLDASKNSKESKRIESEAVTSLRTALSRNEQGGSVENPARSEGDAGLGQEVAKSEEVATPTRKTKDIKKPVPTKELTPKQALEYQNKAKIQEHVDSIDGDDAIKKAIRANLYKKGLLSQVNLTPENIKAAADKEWTNIMTRRKQQAGFIDLGGIADAFRDMKDRLFPDRGEEDPPSKSEIMNKVRQQTKKNVLPVDLKNVNLEDGINRLLAHIYLQAGGAGID